MASVGARIRGWLDGIGGYVVAAGVLLVIALLVVYMVLQPPTGLLWTGQGISGTEQGGIVFYSVRGQHYTLDDPHADAATPAHPVTVYVDPAQPDQAIIDSPLNRWVGGGFVVALLVASAGVVLIGVRRRARTRR